MISGRNPLCYKKKPTYLEDRRLAHGGEFPFNLVSCLKPTALTLTFQPHPSPPKYFWFKRLWDRHPSRSQQLKYPKYLHFSLRYDGKF